MLPRGSESGTRKRAEAKKVEQHLRRVLRSLDAVPASVESISLSLATIEPGDAGTVLFLPERSFFIGLMAIDRERFPEESVLWLAPVVWFMATGLSCLRAMMDSFHREVAEESRVKILLSTTSEFVTDFDEFYDLDLVVPAYKRQYERMKQVAGVERDFESLRSTLETLTNLASWDARRSALATLGLTLTIAFVGVAQVASRFGNVPQDTSVMAPRSSAC